MPLVVGWGRGSALAGRRAAGQRMRQGSRQSGTLHLHARQQLVQAGRAADPGPTSVPIQPPCAFSSFSGPGLSAWWSQECRRSGGQLLASPSTRGIHGLRRCAGPRMPASLTARTCAVRDGQRPAALPQHGVHLFAQPGRVPELKHKWMPVRQHLAQAAQPACSRQRGVGGWGA